MGLSKAKLKEFIVRNIKRAIGIFLCIVDVALLVSFVVSARMINWAEGGQYLLLIGFSVYLIIHFLLGKPTFLYVLAHEVSHSIASAIFGGSLRSITVSEQGGNAKTTRSNFFTLLFPYCFPFYAVLIVAIYAVASLIGNISSWRPVLLFLIGSALSHHLCLTIYSLAQDQSDVKENGALFSLSFIIAANILVLMGFLAVFTKGLSFNDFLVRGLEYLKGFIY